MPDGIAEARQIGDGKNLEHLVESILELECLDQRSFWRARQLKPNMEQVGRTERRGRASISIGRCWIGVGKPVRLANN